MKRTCPNKTKELMGIYEKTDVIWITKVYQGRVNDHKVCVPQWKTGAKMYTYILNIIVFTFDSYNKRVAKNHLTSPTLLHNIT